MKQDINLYQVQFRPETQIFPAGIMLQVAGIVILALILMYAFAAQRVVGIERELEIVAQQESLAIQRLENIGPLINNVTGEKNWAEQLDDSLKMLAERQAILDLIQGSKLGDTQGFSRHLRALARQDVEGIWLTSIVLSAPGNRTRLEGRTIRAELIPLYVQDLTAEAPFAAQRFNSFQIDSPIDEDEGAALHFSMDSDLLLAADMVRQP